jgi:hypothetical protein
VLSSERILIYRFEETRVEGAQGRVVESRYDVVLVSAGPKPRRVARTIAEFTLQERAEAQEMIKAAPVLILQGAGYATAEGARMALERLGATVEVRAYEDEMPEPPPQPSTPLTAGQIALLIVGILIVLAIIGFLIFAAALADAFRNMCIDCT